MRSRTANRTRRTRRTRTKSTKRLPQVTRHTSLATVIVKRSPVHGRGVFAAQPFRKRARIIEYTGRRILWSSVPDELDDPRMYYFGIGDGKRVIDPSVGGNEAQWINHSCDPNCEV